MDDFQSHENNDQNEETLPIKHSLERDEYFEKLKNWLDDARLWHNKSGHPYGNVGVSNGSVNNQTQQPNTYATLAQINLWNENLQNTLRQRFPNAVNGNTSNSLYQTYIQSPQANIPPSTYQFVIPPLWKRMVAEFMDFLILFLVKMALTFLVLESFDIIDLEFFGFEAFQKNLENPEIAMPIAVELLTLELLHRLVVCAYETYFLKGKFCATPGKRYMGLIVVTAESFEPVPGRINESILLARHPRPLSWQNSIIRAASKNIFVGLFLPLCVAFYIFPYNRTSYDMMSNSIVVEYHHEFMVYNTAV